jgi:hypothetical protein
MIRATDYYGQFYYETRRGDQEQPVEERISILRPDLAIVDRDIWDLANESIGYWSGREQKYEYLFARRVKCMHGHKMTAQPSQSRGRGPMRFYYKCGTRKYTKKRCDLPFFRSTVADEVVFKWILELLENPGAKLRGIQHAQRVAAQATREIIEQIAACNTTIEREERELDHLYEDRKKFRTNQRMIVRIEKDIEETSERIERVKQNRAEYQERVTGMVMSDEEVAYRIAEIERIHSIIERLGTLTFAQRRHLVELLNIIIILGIEDERRYVDIVWYGDTERKWLPEAEEVQQLNSHLSVGRR